MKKANNNIVIVMKWQWQYEEILSQRNNEKW